MLAPLQRNRTDLRRGRKGTGRAQPTCFACEERRRRPAASPTVGVQATATSTKDTNVSRLWPCGGEGRDVDTLQRTCGADAGGAGEEEQGRRGLGGGPGGGSAACAGRWAVAAAAPSPCERRSEGILFVGRTACSSSSAPGTWDAEEDMPIQVLSTHLRVRSPAPSHPARTRSARLQEFLPVSESFFMLPPIRGVRSTTVYIWTRLQVKASKQISRRLQLIKMSPTSKRFTSRAPQILRSVKRNLAAGLRRCRRGAAATPEATAAPPSPPAVRQLGENAFAVDADALLLPKPSSPGAAFPPYFLAAVEAGGYARGLVLLALYPALRALPRGARVRAMAMVSFCGLRRDEAAKVGRAVLPKLFSREAPGVRAVEALRALPEEAKVVAVSQTFPTVMVEAFLKEYAGFDAVAGRELKGGPRYLTGAMAELDTENVARVLEQTEKTTTSCGYCPKPVVFHDGRLAFTPTPVAALAMYIYFPFGIILALVRIAIYVFLPWRVSCVAAALTGVRVRVTGAVPAADDGSGRLYACNHRTLLDAVGVASALGRPVASVSYSLGRLSEVICPIPLRRLTRDREEDRRRMASMLARGDVVVCPEGTTCREPFLLRFSPLFAELAAEVTPVAVDARTSVFYGTSTAPLAKSLDSLYFLMNPRPEYSIQLLEPVRTEGGKSSIEVANEVQRALASALGFEATTLTRKDKYLLLAGNEGVVKSKTK